MQSALAETANLEIREAAAEDLRLKDGRIAGVVTGERDALSGRRRSPDNRNLSARSHPYRRTQNAGGPDGGSARDRAFHDAGKLRFASAGLKTGTPPRLDGRSIDWGALEHAAGR